MLKVDSVTIWPVPALADSSWGQGICIANMVPPQRLTGREAFLDLIKTINVPFNKQDQEEEIDALFSSSETKNEKKRSIEQMVVMAGEFKTSSEKQIAAAASLTNTHALPPPLAKKSAHEERVQGWFNHYNKEGRAGNVGLVPEPVRNAYPRKAPLDLDPDVRSFVTHFAEWNEKHK